MAGTGFKTFVDLDILTAAEVNGFLMSQAVMVFDDATDRSTELGASVAEGMVSYLKDTNQLEKYDGAAWVPVIALDLDDLGDVDAATPSDGQVLTYNNTSGNWEAATPAAAQSPIGLILALGG
jgi:hypothetical protein